MSEKKELTRAEIARQRRAQRAAKELAQATKRAVKPAVPVSSRVSAPDPDGTRRRTPRQFNIALGMPDVHLHRPSASRFFTGWRIGSIFIVILLGVALYLSLSLPYFRVPSITLLGNNRLTREEIEGVTGVMGQSIFMVQPDEVETRLRMNFPELLLAQVDVYLPNHVYVTMTEREPVILWQQDEGYTWIDSTGVAFRPRADVPGLVPVKGLVTPPPGSAPLDDPLSPTPYMQQELVDSILLLAPHVPADTTMVFDRAFGLGWTDARGWKAFFGTTAKDMPLKIRVYQSLVDSLVSRGVSPTLINVMYPDAPFYRAATVEEEDQISLNSGQ
ncbi:MAG: FtsQ-type POTRA domain-containing protein [Chloroflexi bacterium]|nr:FtsQ-type POTRA domain-containing protein [Chloroflexota bacterium]